MLAAHTSMKVPAAQRLVPFPQRRLDAAAAAPPYTWVRCWTPDPSTPTWVAPRERCTGTARRNGAIPHRCAALTQQANRCHPLMARHEMQRCCACV